MSNTIDSTPIQMPQAKLPNLKKDSKAELEKAAKEFEGMFMDIVMKSMRDTVQESDAFGDTQKVKFFQSMLDTEYAKELGKQGKIGLSAAIMRQLGPQAEAQELKHKPAEKI